MHLQRKIERLVPDRIQRAVDDLGRLLIAIPLNDHKRIRRTVWVSRNQFVGAEKTDSQVSNAWFTLDDITNLHVLGHMPIEQDLTRESTCRDRACWLLSSNFLLVGIWLIKRQLDLDLTTNELVCISANEERGSHRDQLHKYIAFCAWNLIHFRRERPRNTPP